MINMTKAKSNTLPIFIWKGFVVQTGCILCIYLLNNSDHTFTISVLCEYNYQCDYQLQNFKLTYEAQDLKTIMQNNRLIDEVVYYFLEQEIALREQYELTIH